MHRESRPNDLLGVAILRRAKEVFNRMTAFSAQFGVKKRTASFDLRIEPKSIEDVDKFAKTFGQYLL